ncbi:hypothetical protein PRIPAC_87460 [Pristionchus pacificus]|uniref:G protein-coupled receptor n=1 Tax=Pristionchus pacificus TaxID=54126 RepID=A0A2A6B3R4_PRIPA|nr:hypothetical protein PRIPAC_87460 [Pristionchus pacificus]|eukprot:PDM60520.1 G protein-coupled receptor [Pristionchus pacificus]
MHSVDDGRNFDSRTCMFYTFYLPSDAIKKKANEMLSQSISIDFEDHFVAGYDYEIGNPYVPLSAFQISHAFSILMSLFFVVTMTVCALLIYHYIKHNSFSSSQTKLHYRVLMLLAQQAVVPFTFVYTLALICAFSILIRADISFMAPIFTLTTSIPPLCSCLSVIFLTSEYRQIFNPNRKGVSSTAEESRARNTVALATSRIVQY